MFKARTWGGNLQNKAAALSCHSAVIFSQEVYDLWKVLSPFTSKNSGFHILLFTFAIMVSVGTSSHSRGVPLKDGFAS
jgi:hypothetical protein